MEFYDISGTEIKDGDTIIMGDPLYPPREEFKIKEINGVLHYCWDGWEVSMEGEVIQLEFDICKAEIKTNESNC